MNTVGIIAEYNPFHNGHQYHIEQAKKESGCGYAVVVMSGDFVQRGAPAIIDKYHRAQMALSCGADLVLELPARFSLSSAEGFALGGVSLLHNLQTVSHLSFGAESGDAEAFIQIGRLLADDVEHCSPLFAQGMKEGLSYPAARALALKALLPGTDGSFYQSPNNILGMEYCKALSMIRSSIVPVPVIRKDSAYHERTLSDDSLPSASAIREAVFRDGRYAKIEHFIPEACMNILEDAFGRCYPVDPMKYSNLIHYSLIREKLKLSDYLDVNEDLANRIFNELGKYEDLESFTQAVKSRNYTYTRIARSLYHILLGIDSYDTKSLGAGCVPYARILGFRKGADELLHAIRKNAKIPMITKPSDYTKILSDYYGEDSIEFAYAVKLFDEDVRCAEIYESVVSDSFAAPFRNEFKRQIIIQEPRYNSIRYSE